MKLFVSRLISAFIFFGSFVSASTAQQNITVDVYPHISKSIKGVSKFERKKYINLASTPSDLKKNLNTERFNRFMNELEMTVGRKLFVVSAETNWGNGYKEDALRPGWMDTTYFKNKKHPDDNGLQAYRNLWGGNADVAAHDGHNAYPAFMSKYSKDGTDQEFPENTDAAAEMAAFTVKYAYTDFQRPKYFELVNEPDWRFWSDQRFIDHHVKTKKKFTEMNIPTQVGGPCYSVGNFYKKNFKNLGQITNFIDATNNQLDFYSFHIYDYMRWDDSKNDFVGSVSSGLPEEAVFDAIAAHTFNTYGKEFSFVGSEHGGYVTDKNNLKYAEDKLASQYFPGSGFEFEMEKRSISNFVMVNSAITNTLTFMNNPHIVKKTVPFILLQSASWDPYYYSSLLVKENFDKTSATWHEAKLIYFYDFFKDVHGYRVKSFCNDADIQHISLVDGNKLIMVFHNQSNTPGTIKANLKINNTQIQGITIRRLFRKQDFRPDISENTLDNLYDISINAQESIVLFVNFDKPIEQNKRIEVTPYYSKQVGAEFSGSKEFMVSIPNPGQIESAVLRVGIDRSASSGKEVNISLNGTQLNIPVEDCSGRLTSESDYATLRTVRFDPALLKENNVVKVTFPDGNAGGVGAVVIRASRYINNFPVATNQPLKNNFKMYPNPAQNKLIIESPENGNMNIISLDGKTLLTEKLESGRNSFSLNHFRNGNYIVRFQFSNRIQSILLSVLK